MPVQPSLEEEYFARVELEKRKQLQEERLKKVAAEEKRRLLELHFMRCPKCGMELREMDYKGVNVDKCFTCDGVWLDAGEIDILSKLDRPTLEKLFTVFMK